MAQPSQQQQSRIGSLPNIKRVIGTRGIGTRRYEMRNLTAEEITAAKEIVVNRDTEANWFTKQGGCGWNTLLVVLH